MLGSGYSEEENTNEDYR